MRHFYKSYSALSLFILLFVSHSTRAQTYASSQTNGETGFCLGCGVSNPNNAIDNSYLNNYAQFHLTAGIAVVTVFETLIFPDTTFEGCDSLIVGIGASNSPIAVNLFGGISVQTYNGTTANNDLTGITSSNFRLTTTGRGEIILKPTAHFDRVKISLNSSLLGLLSSFRLFYGYTKSAIPAAPVVTPTSVTINAGDSTTLSASSPDGADIIWVSAATDGHQLHFGNTFRVAPASTTIYYAEAISGDCESAPRADTVVVVQPSGSCSIGMGNLIAYYPLNGNANDSSGHGYISRSDHPVPFACDSICKMAAIFADSPNFIELSIPQDSLPRNAITIALWLKGNGGATTSYGVLDLAGSLSLFLDNGPAPRLHFSMHYRSDSNSTVTVTGPYLPDSWFHVVVTYDGSELKLFINGRLVDSRPETGGIPYPVEFEYLGANRHEASFLFGKMDEVYISSAALSDDSVRAFYNSYSHSTVIGIAAARPQTVAATANTLQPLPSPQPIRLYPNPSSGIVHFAEGSQAAGAIATVRDQQGRQVFRGIVSGNSLDLSRITASGIYFIQLTRADKQIFNDKIILVR